MLHHPIEVRRLQKASDLNDALFYSQPKMLPKIRQQFVSLEIRQIPSHHINPKVCCMRESCDPSQIVCHCRERKMFSGILMMLFQNLNNLTIKFTWILKAVRASQTRSSSHDAPLFIMQVSCPQPMNSLQIQGCSDAVSVFLKAVYCS